MQHKLHTFEDHPDQEVVDSCFICIGGLALCTICGGAEGAMPTHCPGVRMTEQQIDAVYAGTLDYQDGQWVDKCSPHSPRSIGQDDDDYPEPTYDNYAW